MPQNELAEIMRARVRGEMPRDQLYARIVEFLSSQTMCVLATWGKEAPRATPIEYYSEGVSLYVTIDPGVKMENLKINNRVSVAVCSTLKPDWNSATEWASIKSAQITGIAHILPLGSAERAHALKVYKYWIFAEACGLNPEDIIKDRTMVRIDPEKIEYLEFNLKRQGFGSKQVWVAQKQS